MKGLAPEIDGHLTRMIGRLKREAAPGRTETRDMAARAKLRDIFRRTISKGTLLLIFTGIRS